MGGCVAPYCNSVAKEYTMKRFPEEILNNKLY